MADHVEMLFRELNSYERYIEKASTTLYVTYIALASAAVVTAIKEPALFISSPFCLLVGFVSLLFAYHLHRLRWWKKEYSNKIADFIKANSMPTENLPLWMIVERKNERLPGIHRFFGTDAHTSCHTQFWHIAYWL